ncbi:MAG: folate-binding protein YgfZ [Burkholderiales bacterium]|nr:folate-binding protein YgfZ [Burkholderiales bacterium]
MCSATATPSDPTHASQAIESDWSRFLVSQPSAATSCPGATASELEFIRDGCLVCDLTADRGVIEVTGPDAEIFLHGQLSSDVRALGSDRAQLSTFSSPKGRVLATLLLWRTPEGFVLQLPASAHASIAKRLAVFVLRSKVRCTVSERFICIGVTGAGAAETLQAAGIALPDSDFGVARAAANVPHAPDTTLRLPGARFQLLFTAADHAVSCWQRLCTAGAKAGNGAAWRWASIRSGIAEIVEQTRDQFVPQMLNYDLLGGVSFTKGCYPGQEIVARTQYRGEIKRRTLLLHGQTQEMPAAAQSIFATRSPDQPIGTVLAAATTPGGGFDVLACIHLDLAEQAELRLGGIDGPILQRLDLPYVLPGAH